MAALEKLVVRLYELLPKKMIGVIGKSSVMKPFRDFVLRKRGSYRNIQVTVTRDYLGQKADFHFVAGLKVAEKAKNKGIENTLLKASIKLLMEGGMSEKAIVFDIGTNYGYLSLVWAKTVSRNGKVFSFEPNPDLAAAFRTSIKINDLSDTVVSENVAVGKENGKTELFLWTTTSSTERNPNSESSIFVELVSIDEYVRKHDIQKCDLIKIDVDGTEIDVLQGASETIDRFNPILIVETNQDSRIIQFLLDKGYTIKDMTLNDLQSYEVLPINIFCVKAGPLPKR